MATYGATPDDPLGWKAIAEGRTAADPLGWAKIAAGQQAQPAAAAPVSFDPNAYGMYSSAVQQTQAKIQQYQQAMQTNPAGAAMYQQAIAEEQARLQQYQQQQQAMGAKYPMQVNEAGYQNERDQTNTQYGSQLAAQDYAQTLAQQRYARQTGDWQQGRMEARNHVDSGFQRRGVFNSGMRQQGLSNFYETGAREQGAMVEGNEQTMGTIAQQRLGLQQQQQGALAQIDMRRQQDIYNQLAGLRAAGG
jgi:hypothetical protein